MHQRSARCIARPNYASPSRDSACSQWHSRIRADAMTPNGKFVLALRLAPRSPRAWRSLWGPTVVTTVTPLWRDHRGMIGAASTARQFSMSDAASSVKVATFPAKLGAPSKEHATRPNGRAVSRPRIARLGGSAAPLPQPDSIRSVSFQPPERTDQPFLQLCMWRR